MAYSLDAIYNSTNWAIRNHSQALMMLQEQAATGQCINRISDDPTDGNRILALRSENRSFELYADALTEVVSNLELSSSVVQSISGEMQNAIASVTGVLSGIYSTENSFARTQMAEQLDDVLEQIISLTNTQRLGHRLFSGADSTVDPYTVVRNDNGEITRVVYQGSYEERNIEVSSGVEISGVFVGNELFRTDDRGAPLFMSADDSGVTTTGVVAGTGTSSARGTVWLTVTDEGGGDYTLSLDGGAVVSGNISDPGSDNVAVVSASGQVLYVNVQNLSSSGIEAIEVQGTYDIFNSLINTRDLLRNGNDVPAEQWHEMMNDMIEAMRQAEEKLTQAFPKIGGRISTLMTLKDSIENMQMSTEDEMSRLQDTDIAQVAVDLARREVLYEMSLSVAAKMFSLSLLDFIG